MEVVASKLLTEFRWTLEFLFSNWKLWEWRLGYIYKKYKQIQRNERFIWTPNGTIVGDTIWFGSMMQPYFTNFSSITYACSDGDDVKTVVDIGANIGQWSIPWVMTKPIFIRAYEPNPVAFQSLCHNLRKQALTCAAVTTQRDVCLYNRYENSTEGRINTDGKGERVAVADPKTVLLHDADMLKIDIECGEIELLKALPLEGSTIRWLYVEMNREDVSTVVQMLNDRIGPRWHLAYRRMPERGDFYFYRR